MRTDGFLTKFTQMLARLVELHGIDPRGFLWSFGWYPAAFQDPTARIPTRMIDIAFKKAAAMIADPAFALRAAECWHPSHLGVLGFAWLSSGTLRNGLRLIERYSRIFGFKATVRCAEAPDGLRFTFDHRRGDAPIGPAMADAILALVLSMCRFNFDATLNPIAVHLRRPEPSDAQPYHEFFGCPLHFGADEDSFVLAVGVVDAPLSSSQPDLEETFDAILAEQLAALGNEYDLAARCKAYLLPRLTAGVHSEEALATAMGMSRRTLQRKLADIGLTYTDVLDATRYDLALRYLEEPLHSVKDITFLLGFSEQSAFSRAFRRWSGKAPSSYRSAQKLSA